MQHVENDEGIILLMSLLISFLVALFISAELLQMHLNEKNMTTIRAYDQLFYTVEKNLEHWGAESQDITQGNILLHKTVIDLGIMPCVIIQQKPAHFYRLTVSGTNLLGVAHTLTMESVYAVSEKNSVIINICPTEDYHIIQEGRQSWRIVPLR